MRNNGDGSTVYGLCIGVKRKGETYVSKHRYIDGQKHHSAGICDPCGELNRKLRISERLTRDGLEAELERIWNGVTPCVQKNEYVIRTIMHEDICDKCDGKKTECGYYKPDTTRLYDEKAERKEES